MKLNVFDNSSFGLVSIPHSVSGAERWEINTKRLERMPFFGAINGFMEEFFIANKVTDRQISYAIWGGVAANLLLNIIDRSKTHYSLHDIEMFFVRRGRIYQPEHLVGILKQSISTNNHFLLEVGGQFIAKIKQGVSIEDFQNERINLRDGDLYLNGVILIIDRINGKVVVDLPSGMIQELISGGDKLDMKDSSNLRHIDRLARRVYRTRV